MFVRATSPGVAAVPAPVARMSLTGRALLLGGLGLIGAYVLLGHLGFGFAFYQERATIIWAPSGLAVAAVWLFGNRVLWAIYLGAFLANLWVSPDVGLCALIAVGNTAEAWLAGWFVRRFDLGAGLRGTRDVLVYFATVVVLATLVSALNGLTWLVLLDGLPLEQVPLAGIMWWLGDVGGVLVVTSVAIAVALPRNALARAAAVPRNAVSPAAAVPRNAVSPAAAVPPSRSAQDVGIVLLTAIAAVFVAIGPWVRDGDASHGVAASAGVLCLVLPYPAAAWAALRFGVRGASAVTAIVALAAVIGTATGAGPFQTGDARIDVVSLWPLLATLSISAMLLAASFEEQVIAGERRFALEAELVKSRSLGELGLLTGGIAHDFNNLLTVIQANSQLMLNGSEALRTECASDIIEATHRGKDLTEQLLAYAGRRTVARQRFDVSLLAAETARLLTPQCPPGATLTLDLAQGAMLDGEPVQVRQVLMNLLINAFDAMRGRRGEIALRVAVVDANVTITVADEGPGIPAEVRAHMFEPFFTTKDGGHGMGLAAVHGIVSAHGGTIAIAQAGQSPSGASVRVQLPASPAPAEAVPAAKAAPARVLVVDDEPGMRRLTALILQRAGFEVAQAGDGGDALTVAAGTRPHVALLDVKLGAESGLDVMARLRAQHPELSVVLMSGFHEQEIDPAIPILAKPFDAEDLVSAVTRAVRVLGA